jgi:cytochrome c553
MRPFFLLVAGGLIVLALCALALWRGESVLDRADPENADQVAQGRVVYAQHCASCHGDSLQGQPNWRIRRRTGDFPHHHTMTLDIPGITPINNCSALPKAG